MGKLLRVELGGKLGTKRNSWYNSVLHHKIINIYIFPQIWQPSKESCSFIYCPCFEGKIDYATGWF
jgi:hypothetical protein